MDSRSVLVVEDEAEISESLRGELARRGFDVGDARCADEARRLVASGPRRWDLLLLDVKLPDGDGLSLLEELLPSRPDLKAIVMSGYASLDHAVRAAKLGAHDYIAKPFETEAVVDRIHAALEATARRHGPASRIVGDSAVMRALASTVERIAASECEMVLLTGETGTGKDLIARTIHDSSRRAAGPFVTVTCTAIADSLFESELFGHEKGAFTGADVRKKGLLELADGGTVFLDEIGDLSPNCQAKVLRFLQERVFKPVGSVRDVRVDVRVIAATHQPLGLRVREGRFRADLYHRLNVVAIRVPPLRERREDIPLLATAFVSGLAPRLERRVEGLTDEALAALTDHPWPGNVRQLKNAIERALVLGDAPRVRLHDLPRDVLKPTSDETAHDPAADPPVPTAGSGSSSFELPPAGIDIERLERDLLFQALAMANGNKTRAARLLGLNRDQVRYRLKKYRGGESGEGDGA